MLSPLTVCCLLQSWLRVSLQHVFGYFVRLAAEKVLERFLSEFLAVKSEQFYRLGRNLRQTVRFVLFKLVRVHTLH